MYLSTYIVKREVFSVVWTNFEEFGCANNQGKYDSRKYVEEKCVAEVVPSSGVVVIFNWMSKTTWI